MVTFHSTLGDVPELEPAFAGGAPAHACVDCTAFDAARATGDYVVVTDEPASDAGATEGVVAGSFRLALDTAGDACGSPSTYAVRARHVTGRIPFDATQAELATALTNLPNVRTVTVGAPVVSSTTRTRSWSITFSSHAGSLPRLEVEGDSELSLLAVAGVCAAGEVLAHDEAGFAPGLTCDPSDSRAGVAPLGYAHAVASVGSLGQAPFTFRLRELSPGVPCWVRVSARNYGAVQRTAPTWEMPPIHPLSQPPTAPVHRDARPVLRLVSGTELAVAWGPPVSAGGSPVTRDRVEWDTAPTFDSVEGVANQPHGYVVLSGAEAEGKSGRGSYTMASDAACPACPLTRGRRYYVRVMAYNADRGYGEAALAEPESEVPRELPGAPAGVSVAAESGTSLRVRFGAAEARGGPVTDYRVEWFARGTEAPSFGVTEVQRMLLTSRGPLAGSIRLGVWRYRRAAARHRGRHRGRCSPDHHHARTGRRCWRRATGWW
ncbi:MAG: hypothetical protein ACK4ZJ_07805 [Allorhizobium sp.]